MSSISITRLRKQLKDRADSQRTRGVYGLADPKTGEVRYIGMSEHIERRFIDHVLYAGRERTLNKRYWVAGLLVEGFVPELRLLEAVPDGDMAPIEREWIRAYELVGQADMNWSETTRKGKRTKNT